MKKILSLMLIAILLLCLSACDNPAKVTDDRQVEQLNNEKSVEEIYDRFLNGEITAVYADYTDIKIDYLIEMATPNRVKYALFDRNGDSVPELCISNELYVTTFWVNEGKLKLWSEENYRSQMLNNGNCLETHYGGTPNHTDYSYIMYDYNGKQLCGITVSVLTENGDDVKENVYAQDVYIPSSDSMTLHTEITKEQFDAQLKRISEIGVAEIEWKTIE